MNKLPKHSRLRKDRASPPQIPLFDHAERLRARALPLPARWIARTRSVLPATALVIAETLFNCEGDR
jgi:hypothetical protein